MAEWIDVIARKLMLCGVTDTSTSIEHLLRRRPPREALEWASKAVGGVGRALSVEPLGGGRSHANHLIRIDAGGSVHEVVLRRWVRPDWQQDDPDFSPAQEAATYGLLASSAVPAPRLLGADIDASECDVPALLTTRAPGAPPGVVADMGSFLTQLAAVLPLVHEIDPGRAAGILPPYRPYYEPDRLRVPAWARRPAVWQRAIEVTCGPAPEGPSAFIHRDYHPGNTLWVAGRLTAIVDWTSASWGPPSVDIAHMRANLAMSFGVETADEFLDACREVAGRRDVLDAFWDLRAAFDFMPELPWDDRPDGELDRLEEFVARTLARL